VSETTAISTEPSWLKDVADDYGSRVRASTVAAFDPWSLRWGIEEEVIS
jgi:hypothetical protein